MLLVRYAPRGQSAGAELQGCRLVTQPLASTVLKAPQHRLCALKGCTAQAVGRMRWNVKLKREGLQSNSEYSISRHLHSGIENFDPPIFI